MQTYHLPISHTRPSPCSPYATTHFPLHWGYKIMTSDVKSVSNVLRGKFQKADKEQQNWTQRMLVVLSCMNYDMSAKHWWDSAAVSLQTRELVTSETWGIASTDDSEGNSGNVNSGRDVFSSSQTSHWWSNLTQYNIIFLLPTNTLIHRISVNSRTHNKSHTSDQRPNLKHHKSNSDTHTDIHNDSFTVNLVKQCT